MVKKKKKKREKEGKKEKRFEKRFEKKNGGKGVARYSVDNQPRCKLRVFIT